MIPKKDYIKINKESWNNKTDIHYNSEFYDTSSFIKGRISLNDIEIDLLGDVKDKSILHLQCHFGQDTISLCRLGAKVTGIDFSDKAIDKARELNSLTKTDATFICCDIYELPQHLDKKFDIVYTSYGTIGWFPDVNKWAGIVSRYLNPGGKFIFVEFHPVVWMFDDDFTKITYNYFNTGPIVENEAGTYADPDAPINQEYVNWNHSISEVVKSLLNNNLEISLFDEYDYSPYNCLNDMIEYAPHRYRIKKLGNNIPMVYSIVAKKKYDSPSSQP